MRLAAMRRLSEPDPPGGFQLRRGDINRRREEEIHLVDVLEVRQFDAGHIRLSGAALLPVLDADCPRDVLDAGKNEGARPCLVDAEVADDCCAVAAYDFQVFGFVDEEVFGVLGLADFGQGDWTSDFSFVKLATRCGPWAGNSYGKEEKQPQEPHSVWWPWRSASCPGSRSFGGGDGEWLRGLRHGKIQG